MKTMSNMLLATIGSLAFAAYLAGPAQAGRGGSAARIQNAVTSGSPEAIIAEVERAERLVSAACVEVVMPLLDHQDERVREVAAWWFARRPMLKYQLAQQATSDLAGGNAVAARNAADLLGTFRDRSAIPALSAAAAGNGDAEVRAHAVRALGLIAHLDVDPALAAAMDDSSASVRYEAVHAWRDIRHQGNAAPVVARIADSDVTVRRAAAAVVGGLREAGARAALETRLQSDADPAVRRNAAWALGRLGDAASRPALQAATDDASSLVRATARAALRQLR